MIRFRGFLWLLVLAGCGAPRARIAVERLPGTRPELVLLRCQALGLKRPRYDWTIGSSVHQVGWGAPRDEAALFVSVDKGAPANLSVSCKASEEGGRSLEASTSLAPITFKSATAPKRAGELVVVEGSGFGGKPLDGDALWLIPPRGNRVALDHACKGAAWTDAKITACLPAQLAEPPGRYELRLESGGRLAATAISLGPVK